MLALTLLAAAEREPGRNGIVVENLPNANGDNGAQPR